MRSLAEIADGFAEDQRLSLLDGRLTAAMPREAEYRPIVGLKSHPHRTRIVITGLAGESMTLYAEELFMICEVGLADAVRTRTPSANQFISVSVAERQPAVPGLEAVFSTRPNSDNLGWYGELHVRHPDTSLQLLRFASSPEAARQGAARRLAWQIAETLRPGPRFLDGHAREHRLVGDASPALAVRTPARWYVNHEVLRSEERHLLHRLGVFPHRLPSLVRIYVSANSFIRAHTELIGVTSGPPLFGRPVMWHTRKNALYRPNTNVRSAMLPFPGHDGFWICVQVDDDAPDLAPEIDAILTSLRTAERVSERRTATAVPD